MAAPKTLQDYLKSLPEWKSASKEVNAAKARVSELNSALTSAPEASKSSIKSRLASANATLSAATSRLNKIQENATTYYNDNPDKFAAKVTAEKISQGTKNVEDAIRTKNALIARGASAAQIAALDKRIAELQGKISTGFQESPKPGSIVDGQPNTETEIKSEDFAGKIKTARQYIKSTLDNNGRLALSQSLKDAGIEVPITGEFTEALVTAYKSAITGAQNAWNANKEFPTVSDFLSDQIRQVRAIKAAGGGGLPETTGAQQIYDKSTAEGVIDNLFQSFLKRDASPAEINSLYKQLDAEQRKASSISTTKYKVINGIRVKVDEIKFDPRVFLENKIKELPAYKESQAAKAEQNKLSLASTALANGYNLETDFANDLPNWLDAINKGENISKFQNIIRVNARRMLPEAVRNQIAPDEDLSTTFSTYMSNIARAKGVPINTIRVQDVIPLAVTDKGFADMQQFEVKKRSQAWWDESPEGISVTTTVLNDTLKDFGMLGQGVRTV
jgi:hypothetical protein